jgi:high-affinity iron transporter
MTAGLLITFREGLEAFLVVGIILSYLGRLNLKKYNKWIYMGVFLGLISAFGLGILFQLYYSGFESRLGELQLKVAIMGFAVVVLTYMVIWMSRNSRHIKGSVEKALEIAVSTGNVATLVFMAYLAILREGFETVLFLGAVFGDNLQAPVFYGGALGLVIALAVTIALFRGMRQIPIKMFFKVTGGLIVVIAAGLCVNMVGVMQDINMLPVFRASLFDLSWLMNDTSEVGVFFKALFGYTHSPSLMQVIVYPSYLLVTIGLLNGIKVKQPAKRIEAAPAGA